MVDQQILGRVLKEAVKSGKYTLGTREVLAELKSSKVVIAAAPRPGAEGEVLKKEAEKNHVPVIWIEKNSAALGRLVGRSHKVSAIALRSISDQDLRQLQA
ncbi:MAG: ribosomal L7Ae/L30e/S12e/Gadd45 family protein [Thaumarchaeota archaeon]|nr:ribosomal L7Ae/L30e/S12e/Gadd45 family protein [Nitrososphaerota archaeon]